jgi:hypothetical protein
MGALATIREQYPMFSDIEVRDMRDQGIQNGRKLEFTEAYDDRYDKPLIQIFDPALQGQELEQAVIANTYTKRQGAVQNMPPCDQSK